MKTSQTPLALALRRSGAVGLGAVFTLSAAWSASSQVAWAGNSPEVRREAVSAGRVDVSVTEALARGERPNVIVKFRGKADLSGASGVGDRNARARFVYEQLTQTASSVQGRALVALRDRFNLRSENDDFVHLWIDNSLAVNGISEEVFAHLSALPEVESIRLQRIIPLPTYQAELNGTQPMAVGANINRIKAPVAWGNGFDGTGVVVGSIDSGARHTHNALVAQYRGTLTLSPNTYDHNYHWYDPYTNAATPRSSDPHGSHTIGTMIGRDSTGTNEIGVAPGAKWVACIGFGGPGGSATDAGLIECGQWMLAPTNVTGASPDPTRHPDVVNNSWGDCGTEYDAWYEGVIDAWVAAGIVPVFANGNAGNCGFPSNPPIRTVGNPARSGKVLGVGSTSNNSGIYATHSMKGFTDNQSLGLPFYPDPKGYPNLKPNVVAPGVSVRSSGTNSDSNYVNMTGTSMSAPTVAGVIALMWSGGGACLKGDYATTGTLLMQTAVAINVATATPFDGPGNVPNQATGWGEVDANAATQAAAAYCANLPDPAPVVSIAVSPGLVDVNMATTVTIGLHNLEGATPVALDANAVVTLPAGLEVAGAATTDCASGSVNAPLGGTSITLLAGATLPAQGSCQVQVQATSASAVLYKLEIPAHTVTADGVENQNVATAVLRVGYSFPDPYCRLAFGQAVEPITHVQFGDIDNESSLELDGSPSLEDFTHLTTEVTPGEQVTLTVRGNTGGNYRNPFAAFFDWDQDGKFDDMVEIGVLVNSNGNPSSTPLSVQVDIPEDLSPGNIRMRVTKGYTDPAPAPVSYVYPCSLDGWGQGEDYTVVVADAPAAPTLDKAFSPATVVVGMNSTLTLTLGNTNQTQAELSADLVDVLPDGLVASSATTTCGGVASFTSGTVTLGAGATIPAEGTCEVVATVSAATVGTYLNEMAVGSLQTDLGDSQTAASATLTVQGANIFADGFEDSPPPPGP